LKKISAEIDDLYIRRNINTGDAHLFYRFFLTHTYGFKIPCNISRYIIEQRNLYGLYPESFSSYCEENDWEDVENVVEPEIFGLSMPSINLNHNVVLPPELSEITQSLNRLFPKNAGAAESEESSMMEKILSMGYLGVTTIYIARTQSYEMFLLSLSQQIAVRYAHVGGNIGTDILTRLAGCSHMTIDVVKRALLWIYQWFRGEVDISHCGILCSDLHPENTLEEIVGEISDNNPLFALFGMVWSWMPFSSKEFALQGDSYSKRFVNFVKGLQGLKTAAELIPQIIEWAVCHAIAWWKKCTYEEIIIARKYGEKYRKTLQEARAIIARFEEDNLVASPIVSQDIQRIWEECVKMNTDIGRNAHPAVTRTLNFITKQIGDLRDIAGCHRTTSRQKPEPISIWLIGKPGQGKSNIYKHLMKDVFAMLGFPAFRDLDVFTRNPTDQFWENYTGQKVCLFDDWGAVRSEEQWQEAIGDMIRIINNAPCTLTMAAIEKKTNTFFSSPFCIYTTNKGFSSEIANSATQAKAILRRRHFLVDVELADVSVANTLVDDIDKSRWILHLRDAQEIDYNGSPRTPVSYDSLVTMIANKYMEHYLQFMKNELKLTQPTNVEAIRSSVPQNLVSKFDALKEYIEALSVTTAESSDLESDTDIDDILGVLDDVNTEQYSFFNTTVVNYWEDVKHYFVYCSQYVQNTMELLFRELGSLCDMDFSLVIGSLIGKVKDFSFSIRGCLISAIFAVFRTRFSLRRFDFTTLKRKLDQLCGQWGSFVEKFSGPMIVLVFAGVSMLAFIIRNKVFSVQAESTENRERRRKELNSNKSAMKRNQMRKSGTFASSSYKNKQAKGKGGNMHAQTGDIPQLAHITKCVESVVRTNMCLIWCGEIRNQMLFIGDKTALTTRHTMDGIAMCAHKYQVSVLGCGHGMPKMFWSGDFSELSVVNHPNKDLCLVTFPGVQDRTHILKYFSLDQEKVGNKPAMLVGISSSVVTMDYDQCVQQPFSTQSLIIPYISYEAQDLYKLMRPGRESVENVLFDPGVCLQYPKMTTKGDCGKLIVQPGGKAQMQIVGIHQAANNYKGIASPVSQKDLELMGFSPKTQNVDSVLTAESVTFHPIEEVNDYIEYVEKYVHPIVKLDGKFAARYPTKSSIARTAVYDYVTRRFPSLREFAPAIMHKRDGIDPMQMQVNKQFVDYCTYIPLRELQYASTSLLDHLTSIPQGKYPQFGKLSLHVAVNGDSSLNLNGLAMNTSEGYPFIWKRPKQESGKKWLVNACVEDNITYYSVTDTVKNRISMLEDELENGQIPIVFVNDLLKDEIRPMEKVLAGKTRMFMCSDFAWNVVIRRYFGGFLGFIYNNCDTLEISIGINPHGPQWTQLYNRLFPRTQQRYFFAGDFGNYDKSLPYQLIMEAGNIINQWYNDEHAEIRNLILRATYNTYHINGNIIYRTYQGNPSGTPLTSLINSMVNCLLMRLAFNTIMNFFSLDLEFNNEVKFACFGDDNVGSVSYEASEFSMKNISRALASYGMEYTHPNKVTNIEDTEFLELNDITYLKRSFEFNWPCKIHVSAPLDLDSILRPLCWRDTRAKVTQIDYLTDICNDIMREMAHHPNVLYKEIEQFLMILAADHPTLQIKLKRFDRHVLYMEMIGSDALIRGGSAFSSPTIVEPESGNSGHQNCVGTPHNLFRLATPHRLGSAHTDGQIIRTTENNEKLNEISGEDQAAKDQVTIKNNIVHFEDKAAIDSDVLVPCEKVPDVSFGVTETLEQVLQRPIRVGSFSWTPSMVQGQYIYLLDFPSAIIQQSSFIRDKLREFSYLRCDIEISIRVNGTAFHYGKLLFAWDPCMRFMDLNYRNAVNNVYSASGNPFVLVSPTQSETVVFTVPFVFPYYYLMLNSYGMDRIANTSAYRSLGGLKTYVLNPLTQYSTAPSNPVGVSIYARMVNVSLQGPANLHEFAVTPLKPIPTTMLESESTTGSSQYINKTSRPSTTFVRQAKKHVEARAKSENPVDETMERDEESTSITNIPVTGTFSRVRNVMKKLYSSLIDKSAPDMFKHECNPLSLDPYKPMVPRLFNLANTHSLNPSTMLTLHPDASVDKHPCLMGSHSAEMDLDYIFSTPSLAQIIQWSADSGSGAQLIDWTPVRPGYRASGYDTVLSWTTLPFQMWRGSIRVMFHITASSFHAGRLALVWVPPESGYVQDSPTLLSTLEGKSIMRIIDIKTESQVAVTFPYFSMKPWKLRTALDQQGRLNSPPNIGDGSVFDNYASGYFAFFVVNELTHSENPPPPVYINAFVSGGEDFQVAFPSVEKLDINSFNRSVDTEMQPESFMRDEIRTVDYTPMFEYSTIPDNRITVPEVPTTVNEVTARYYHWRRNSECPMFNRFASVFSIGEMVYSPFYIWFESVYRFRRGDFNFKVVPEDVASSPNVAALQITSPAENAGLLGPWIDVAVTPDTKKYMVSQGAASIKSPVSNGLEVSIPYMGTSLCEVVGLSDTSDRRREQGLMVNSTVALFSMEADTSVDTTIFLATGDNYKLGFIVGPPARTQ
jgi:hypothetical protein